MAAGISASFSLMVCFLVSSSDAQEKITAELGKNVILPCKVPNKNIRAVEWSRPDQKGEYVLSYRGGHLDPEKQHPCYQNRVDLQDKEMKDGDASMILKNVTMEDTGTYECRVFEKRKNELISIINLEVRLSGNKDGIIVGSVVGVIVLALLGSVGCCLNKQRKKKNSNRLKQIRFPRV